MRITIIGAGKVGSEIARRLAEDNHDIVVIDRDEAKLTKIEQQMDVMVVKGNASSASVLKLPEVLQSDLVAAVTNSDEVNMIACMMAKKLGVPRTVARIRDPVYARDLVVSKEDLGLDLIVNPEYSAALEIARLLTVSLPVHTEPFADGKVQMADVSVDDSHRHVVNKRLMDINVPESCLIVGISRKGQMIVPGGHDTILPGDTLYLIGHVDSVNKFAAKLKRKRHQKTTNVMILGGGRIGFYLGEKLCSLGLKPKIIEQDPEKCRDLAERLPDALILQADGSDIELLKREGIKETDGFVAVTGFDEENLLISLLAKQLGAKQVIAKVSRPSYTSLIEQLGVDAAISPRLIMASAILRYIRGGRLLSLVLLLNGQAEVIELILHPDSRTVGKPLSKLGLPKGIIIGAIKRGNQIIIPKGDVVLNGNDRLVVFAVGHHVSEIDGLLNVGGVLSE
ncbi:Trk system potassium transporter TrkA [Desulforudis sp. 1088]|uniref:Trk system potassium transporter TrkA n=1 Tax=unclassified Candidatus Desulforudis TaxID=2635950 RepID=UPI003CE5435D